MFSFLFHNNPKLLIQNKPFGLFLFHYTALEHYHYTLVLNLGPCLIDSQFECLEHYCKNIVVEHLIGDCFAFQLFDVPADIQIDNRHLEDIVIIELLTVFSLKGLN